MKYGFIKSTLDVHTLGLASIADLLQQCGYAVRFAPPEVCRAFDEIAEPSAYRRIAQWLRDEEIRCVGFTYRLDPERACELFNTFIHRLDSDPSHPSLDLVCFAALPDACARLQREHGTRFALFQGDETPLDSLAMLGVPASKLPHTVRMEQSYDEGRLAFARELIARQAYVAEPPLPELAYPGYGTFSDTLEKRLAALAAVPGAFLIRAHVGPYHRQRELALAEFDLWLSALSAKRHLDILSIGSSQLSQERFGQDWRDAPNGGGVPINSESEFRAVRDRAEPMLVRSYSGTNAVAAYAAMLERTLNTAWHALSLWWFNRADGRGPLSLRECLRQHVDTLGVIARAGKPFEPNVGHHFSFRGCDDLGAIVATWLAVRTAQRSGVKTIVLQMMLNTPKAISGLGDLVKWRALLRLLQPLRRQGLRIHLQPRAGLAYFSPDLHKAREQLAAVSGLMCDIDPSSERAPSIVHVVSYSEAVSLATPDIVSESAQITRHAIRTYRASGIGRDLLAGAEDHLRSRVDAMCQAGREMIDHMERHIPDLYTAEGLYQAYARGYFPVPQLWECREELQHAVNWNTRMVNGSMTLVDKTGAPIPIHARLGLIESLPRLPDAAP